jgi:hypothetical protein
VSTGQAHASHPLGAACAAGCVQHAVEPREALQRSQPGRLWQRQHTDACQAASAGSNRNIIPSIWQQQQQRQRQRQCQRTYLNQYAIGGFVVKGMSMWPRAHHVDQVKGWNTPFLLLCRLNKCGVISPRYDLRHGDIETWIAKLLPSRLVSCLRGKVALMRRA